MMQKQPALRRYDLTPNITTITGQNRPTREHLTYSNMLGQHAE
jgi:hypothetical protein